MRITSDPAYGRVDSLLTTMNILNNSLPDDLLFHLIFVLTREGKLAYQDVLTEKVNVIEPYYRYVASFIKERNEEEEAELAKIRSKGKGG